MTIGAHSMIFSRNSDADRAFVRDVLGLSNVDVGGGWLRANRGKSRTVSKPRKAREKGQTVGLRLASKTARAKRPGARGSTKNP